MPRAEHGFITAIIALVVGFTFSAILDVMTPIVGPEVAWIRIGFNILSIAVILQTIHNVNFWGNSYTIGYFSGLVFFGKFFMEGWELLLYAGIVTFFLFLKVGRKASWYY